MFKSCSKGTVRRSILDGKFYTLSLRDANDNIHVRSNLWWINTTDNFMGGSFIMSIGLNHEELFTIWRKKSIGFTVPCALKPTALAFSLLFRFTFSSPFPLLAPLSDSNFAPLLPAMMNTFGQGSNLSLMPIDSFVPPRVLPYKLRSVYRRLEKQNFLVDEICQHNEWWYSNFTCSVGNRLFINSTALKSGLSSGSVDGRTCGINKINNKESRTKYIACN